MSHQRSCQDYLADIADAAEKALKFIQGMTFERFVKDDKTQFAVIRALEIIGEASKKVSSSIKTKHSDLPWKEMAAIRDKLIHDYFGVDPRVVWKTVSEDIPALLPKIQRIRNSESSD